MAVTTATITNTGQTLLAGALIGSGQTYQISYIALGTGCGTLASGLTSGNTYTALSLASGLPAAVPAGASLTLYDGTNSQTVTENGGGASLGATSITVSSFTANANYAAGTGVTTTPSVTDTQLFCETFRNVTTSAAAGGAAGEIITSLYIAPTDGTTPTTWTEIGFFAGAATSSINSGTLVARAVYNYAHTSSDSGMAQLDTTV